MGYKKYSPFLKSVKILILLSFMYFTSKLDAIDLRNPKIPVTLNEFDYDKLPVYCEASTGHFPCKGDKGEVYCLANSLKCRMKCANDAELNCGHAATTCKAGQYQCQPRTLSNATEPLVCILEAQLCDGRVHCPAGDDESLELCSKRTCGPDQFPCRSPGHCIPNSRRCDGHEDCQRPGLDDRLDEQNCHAANRPLTLGSASRCGKDEFACTLGDQCIGMNYWCDTFQDCRDGSDEVNCPLKCAPSEFECDQRCMKNSLKCDGRVDCADHSDEKHCSFLKKCMFSTEFMCVNSNTSKCVSKASVCDTDNDCGTGDDEVCPIGHSVCSDPKRWVCKSRSHCILEVNRCDSIAHCPDGSDEMDCPTSVPPPAPVVCPPGYHHCNGTRTCVDMVAACEGSATCPKLDTDLQLFCRNYRKVHSPCLDNNGGCEQICSTSVDASKKVVARCSCRPGFKPSPEDRSRCVDLDECKLFGSCDQLCTNTMGSYSCGCTSGYRLHGSTCLAHGAVKLLVATDSAIQHLDLETNHSRVVHSLHYPKYLAYDHARKLIFYHLRSGVLGSVQTNGMNSRTLLNLDVPIDAIAYDWTRGLLFYSKPQDEEKMDHSGHIGVINVTSNDPNATHRAILRVVNCPRGLAIDPHTFTVFFTMWCDKSPGIYSMKMDGTDFRRLVNLHAEKPNHLATDLTQTPARIYWSDSALPGIFSATVDGHDRRGHVHGFKAFDLAVFQDRLYFTDLRAGKVYSTNKFVAKAPVVRENVKSHAALSLLVYHSLMQPAPRLQDLRRQRQDCACHHHICLTGAGAVSCLCDVNYRKDSETGQCLPQAGYVPNRGSVDPPKLAASSPSQGQQQQEQQATSLEGQVGSVAGIVIGALCVCLILGVAVAMYCLRVQDRQSVNLACPDTSQCKEASVGGGGGGGSGSGSGSGNSNSGMPKVNSRTPLTQCDVDMEGSNSRF